MISFDVGVILPAAGTGQRVGAKAPKQYIPILGQPLLLFALEEVLRPPWVRRVVIVVDTPEKVQMMLDESSIKGIDRVIVIEGAHSRHRSIRCGLQALKKAEAGLRIVVVHDAVRPLVPIELLEQLVSLADRYGAAGAVRPLTSTVLRASSGVDKSDTAATLVLETSLDRSAHCASETPQAFQMGVLITAYNKSTDDELDHGTECLALVLKHTGLRARLVEGPPDLWKVTHKKDVYAAIGCLRERSMHVCVVAAAGAEAPRVLAQKLSLRVKELVHVSTDRSPSSPPTTAAKAFADVKGTATFNTVVFFHIHEISQDCQLLDLATVLDVDKQGVIIHVVEHLDGGYQMRDVSALELHHSARHMSHHYEKLNKAVAVVHWFSVGEEKALADLIVSLILSDNPHSFSGQTHFL